MTFLSQADNLSPAHKEGLHFDIENATLFAVYHDEISAYRARKRWRETLHGFFLLDEERDYEIVMESALDALQFVIRCTFHSACGRYAFWRLMNQQAPEVEAKLAQGCPIYRPRQKSRPSSMLDDQNTRLPWILSMGAELEKMGAEKRRTTLFQGLMRLFR